jgi:hypothetical protein
MHVICSNLGPFTSRGHGFKDRARREGRYDMFDDTMEAYVDEIKYQLAGSICSALTWFPLPALSQSLDVFMQGYGRAL